MRGHRGRQRPPALPYRVPRVTRSSGETTRMCRLPDEYPLSTPAQRTDRAGPTKLPEPI